VRARGLRAQATAEEDGDVLRVARLVCGCATVQGFPRARRPQDAREPVVSPQGGQPGPGKQTGGGQDDLPTGGRQGLEQRCWGRGPVSGSPCFTGWVEDADVHGAGLESDPTVKRVLCRGEAHGGLLLVRYEGLGCSQHLTAVC